MADTLTPNIKLTNQTEGGNNNTWGAIADANFERLDNVLGDTTSIATTGGDTTLSDTQELVGIIDVSGTLTSNSNIIFSGRGGFWMVRNQTSGAYTVTCKVSGETGVDVPQNTTKLIFCDGTDIAFGDTNEEAADEVTVASASTANVLGAGSEFVAVSGTATISSLGTGANVKRFVRATGAFRLTHNATTLILPGGQDIVAASGDTFVVISDASSNARVYAYQRAANPPSGKVVGEITDYAGATAPAFHLFCYGQTLQRAEYPGLFVAIGTQYGSTDSSNFLVPDCRGRVRAGKDDMGGTSANRLTNAVSGSLDGDTLGATGGSETVTLSSTQIPSHNHSATVTVTSVSDHAHGSTPIPTTTSATGDNSGAGSFWSGSSGSSTGLAGAHTHSASASIGFTGSGGAHLNVQPTIVFNTMIYAGI